MRGLGRDHKIKSEEEVNKSLYVYMDVKSENIIQLYLWVGSKKIKKNKK